MTSRNKGMGTALLLTGLLVGALATAQAQTLPDGNGKEIVQTVCRQYHGLDRIFRSGYQGDDWKRIVPLMVGYGAALTGDQMPVVIDYLAKNIVPIPKPEPEMVPGDVEAHITDSQNLIEAAARGDTDTVETLLDAGVDVNAKDNEGWTALMWAAQSGHTATVHVLLDAGADANATRDNGATALLVAALEGNRATVQALLDAGADVNAKRNNGGTALMIAASAGHTATVQALLDAGADVNATMGEGGTALVFARTNGHTEVVEILRNAGAN